MLHFRLITCLPLIWKLLTGTLAEELYKYLKKLTWEQMGYRKGSRNTKFQLLLDKMIVKDCKLRLTSLTVAQIDYHKAYNMVQHSWIQKRMEVFGVAVNVRAFVKPLTLVLRQTKKSYKVKMEGKRINHSLFMDDANLFAKNEDQIDSLVNTVRIFSEDIKKDLELPQCWVLIMKRGKVG